MRMCAPLKHGEEKEGESESEFCRISILIPTRWYLIQFQSAAAVSNATTDDALGVSSPSHAAASCQGEDCRGTQLTNDSPSLSLSLSLPLSLYLSLCVCVCVCCAVDVEVDWPEEKARQEKLLIYLKFQTLGPFLFTQKTLSMEVWRYWATGSTIEQFNTLRVCENYLIWKIGVMSCGV